MEQGWRRDPVLVDEDRIRWFRASGETYLSPDPEGMREPVRQAWRARLIGFFNRMCPVCEQRACWMTRGELEAADRGRLQVVTAHRATLSGGQAASVVMAIEHTGECEVCPRTVDRWDASSLN